MPRDEGGSRALVTPTRLRVPRLAAGLVRRERLLDGQLGSRPVTLVCAPAGSGKTMLVAAWAAEATVREEPIAWLSLVDGDDRPFEFWSSLIEALRTASTPDVAAALDELSPPRDTVEPGFVAAVAAILSQEGGPRWLVLDDAQRLTDPAVLAGLDLLLADPPPGLGVVLVARWDPPVSLHRLRLAGLLHEVRAADLAFTEPEAAELFSAIRVALSGADVARLVARTEGWAAGLRLAAVSLSDTADPTAFVAAFEGDQRAVADYLFAEIVQHLPADLHRFLLDTCIPEQLSVALAAELSGRSDAGALLDRLCRANALVVQSGDMTWYRYHSLLRTYLESTLRRQDVLAPGRQHAAVAHWFEAHEHPAAGLEHALHSGDEELLAGIVRRRGLRLILTGQAAMVRDTLAAAPETLLQDDTVAVVAALACLDTGDPTAADRWLAAAGHAACPDRPRTRGMWASAVIQRALVGGDVSAALEATGILGLPATGDGDVDLMVWAYRGPARMRSGDYTGAVDDLRRALSIARAEHYDPFVLWSLSQLSGMAGSMCDLPDTLAWAEEAITFATRRGWVESPRLAYAYLLAAWTAFLTGDVDGQARYARLGMRALDGVNNVEVEVGVRAMHELALFEAASGPERRRAAEAFHAIWQDPVADQVSPALSGHAGPQEVRMALAVGEFRWATEAATRLEERLPGSSEAATLRAQVMRARGRTTDALRLLAPVLRGRTTTHLATTTVIAHLLAAPLEAAASNDGRAFESLCAALEWAAPQNCQRPFLDAWAGVEPLLLLHQGRFGLAEAFVADLLAARPRTTTMTDAHPLSPRELELLGDLPSMLSVKEIADARGVSINTAKTHLGAIYRKLGVGGRNEAVREARRRGLL
ncbi:putative LuxR family transcriptional regulator [Nostocoides japonicum T1-X7]|uniref:Putative LuxR family transcriptional regulator n=1 Tax=Nostocoides japonicum T1-X7 TaxID=1194083 RepID=A0A077LVC2_9MICO|nr:LuxR C-terminal-related transcriptional regulator [Tetrasphaera japonica]CCH77636.1 putative LuxR family transcriptional regulator [Tetrasphaera japonica T1-X7]